MTPRVRLTATPQAFNSDLLDGLDSTNFVQLSAGNINIGSGTLTSGAINGLSLTQAADGFTLAGGTTSRTLTVTGANITVGSTIQPTSAGSLNVQSNGTNALTLTSGAAATWSTTAGLLTVQGFGGIAVNTPGASGATSAITIQTGNSSAGTAGNITLDTGTTSTGTPTLNIGSANAKALQIGNNTSNPNITIDSGTGTIAVGTGAGARTVNIGTGTGNQAVTVGSASGGSGLDLQAGTGGVDITTQGTGALNVGANAVAQTVNVGNTTGATAVTLQSGTGNLSITTQGTGSLNIGNNAVAQTINIGNATGATTVAVLCGTGACGFGNNAIAHTTTVGSSTGTASTVLQAGSSGISLTSAANITVGAADSTATLFIFDSRNVAGETSAPAVTGVNGAEYYNSSNNKFRCFENSVWKNCSTGPGDTFSTLASPATTAATKAAAGTIIIAPIYVSGQVTVNEMRVSVITTALGAAGDIGIYNAAGTLVLNGGSSSVTTAVGLKTVAPVQTGVARILEPGQYYAAVTWNATTGSISSAALPVAGMIKRVGTITGGGLVLPSTLTFSSIAAAVNMPAITINN
jgi:hypothetical protein